MATNADVAERLGVSHSAVSRMRTGKRVGSPEVLERISTEFHIPSAEILTAAVEARAGKLDKWVKIMERVVDADERD